MDKTTLTKEKERIDFFERELKSLQKQNKELFKNMHIFSKKEFEEKADALAIKIKEVSEQFRQACEDLINKINEDLFKH